MAASPLSTWWRSLVRRGQALASVHGPSARTLWIVAAACLAAGLVIRLARPSGLPDAAALLQEGTVVAGFAALWFAAQPFFEERPVAPLRTLGTPILAGLGLLLAASLTQSLDAALQGPAAIDVVLRHLLVLPELAFALFLLFQLRRLVLYRRTRAGQRNWRLMLLFASVAALTALGRAPTRDPGVLQIIPMVAAIVLMVVNAFRISWIVSLSVRKKMAGAALSLGLLVTCSVALAVINDAGDSALATYSYTLGLFALQACIFGILYSLTALLSLVFHLPTTGDVQRKSDETAALHALAHLVDQTFDAERLSASIASASVEAGSADAAWLALDGASERLIKGDVTEGPLVVAAAGLPAARLDDGADLGALFEEVRRTREPLVLSDTRSDARVEAGPHGELASLLVVPLVARGVFAGALLAARNVTRGFEHEDVSSIQAFASQAALALDHARLFEEQIEKERLERELAIARTVQERLLPRRLPEVEALALAAGSTPAREVGGDYYDFARLDDGRLAFIVADVSGKGTQAAFYMAEMQGLFRSLSRLRPDPAAFLAHANEALRDILEKGTFITALYGVLDPAQETIALARAGHCPPGLLRAGEAPRLLRSGGMALGMAPTPLFRKTLAVTSLPLHAGDALALYTDGLIESRAADGEEYGYERLLGALGKRAREAPAALHDGLLRDLRAFTAADTYDDDLTLVVLRWKTFPASVAHAAPPPPTRTGGALPTEAATGPEEAPASSPRTAGLT